ncbi:MAG TPA: hypothetical protein VNE41_07725 [Chitinophagaceae bacterium]|nr:hypothetical protein [Chitinophagaceae bacterium]
MAALLVIPIAWWVTYVWLKDFAYKNKIRGWVFLLPDGVVLLIALKKAVTKLLRQH